MAPSGSEGRRLIQSAILRDRGGNRRQPLQLGWKNCLQSHRIVSPLIAFTADFTNNLLKQIKLRVRLDHDSNRRKVLDILEFVSKALCRLMDRKPFLLSQFL